MNEAVRAALRRAHLRSTRIAAAHLDGGFAAAHLGGGFAAARVGVAGLCALALACASAAPPRGPSDTVFQSEALANAGVHPTGWRFLPLRPGQEASSRDFDQSAATCMKAHSDGEAVRFCMTQRGFYPTACDDGQDNDGDGLIDHPDDPGCADPSAIREDPACDDGLDNDGDGLVDWDGGGVSHEDPDCESGSQPWESGERRRQR